MILTSAATSWGAEGEELLPLGLDAATETAHAARLPRPTSRIAENVTVITSEQIALLNAHTLADVLQTVPGFQLNQYRTPGSSASFHLQAAPGNHVQLLLDGVPQNELSNSYSDPGSIPAQVIDRIEIIKGAASAAWGPALGGVINVVTKSPDTERKFGGAGFASYGERRTGDLYLETGGTLKRFGYYLAGGSLHSRGLAPNNGVNNNTIFGKFSYDLPGKGLVTVGANYRAIDHGTTASPPEFYDYREKIGNDYFSGFISVTYPLADRLVFDLLLREKDQRLDSKILDFAGLNYQVIARDKQKMRGGSARLTWGDALRNIVGGVEYEKAQIDLSDRWPPGFWPPVPESQLDPPAVQSRKMDRYGVFVNGAYTIGALTILPGLRYDRVTVTDDYFSYTLGATYQLTKKTTLRGYAARAYSLPYALITDAVQKVWTAQAGFETGDIPYLWLKGTFFYNHVEDQVLDFSTIPTGVTVTREKRQGFEVEAKSSPLYGFALGGGYTYTDYRDRDTGERYNDIPANQLKLALHYDNNDLGLKGIVTGNYIWWRLGEGWDGHSNPIVWDISLTQKLLPGHELSPEVFISGHNLFNGSQYMLKTYDNNPRRWFEGGVRFRF
jgi:vitamin B12 transporter